VERLGEYDGVLVTCQFEKTKLDVKVVFNRSGQVSGLFFVPTKSAVKYQRPFYANPATFQEREVQIGTGEWTLPGTLTLPVGKGPFPAVVLVHGSGPNDRDETIGANKPFCDLAWGMASRGVAVLRYEKRTKHYAEKLAALKPNKFTVKEETIDDALAAVSLLRDTEKVAPTKVFLLGHSLGGMLVPRIGTLDTKIAGFIVLAGGTRPLEDIIYSQFKWFFTLDGPISEANKVKLQQLESQVARVKDPGLLPNTPPADLPLGGAPATYWLDLRGYNPPEVARRMKCPILILQGGRDYQSTAEDFQGWKNALSSNKNVQFRLYPKLNHLFIEGEKRSVPAEYEIPGHVAETVVEDVAAWIKRQ
jgi:dienelactone hydrolase